MVSSYVVMAQSKQLTRLHPWHHQLIDWWIANPRPSGREAAAHFGKSEAWISLVKNSPIFRAEFEKRRERISQTFEDRIVGKATAVAEISLEMMSERLERDYDTMPLGQVIKTVAFATKMLGYGPGKPLTPSTAPVQVQINAEVLAELGYSASEVETLVEQKVLHAEMK